MLHEVQACGRQREVPDEALTSALLDFGRKTQNQRDVTVDVLAEKIQRANHTI